MNALAFEGKIEELRQLASTTDLSTFRDAEDGNRGVLHFAVLGKQIDALNILLNEFNCSPEVYDDDDWSPLHVAASVGSELAITLLCQALPSADARVIYCNAPTRRSRQTPLHLAAAKGHEQALLRLLSFGALASKRNAAGQTPLHRAACAGFEFCVTTLLQAEPSIVDAVDAENGQSALHLAAEDGHVGCVKLLLELGGANRQLRDKENRTPADLARTPEIAALL